MPRYAVILAGIFIALAAVYGGLRGFDFTDLDRTPPTPVILETTAAPAASAAPTTPVFDEEAVRSMARAEVRQIIRPRAAPRAAPALVQAPPLDIPSPEAPSTEALVEPPAN